MKMRREESLQSKNQVMVSNLYLFFPASFFRNFLVLAIYSEHALPASFSWGIYPIHI